jgi:delta24-sterol reductase
MNKHATLVKEISAKVTQLYKTKTPFRINHGSSNTTRHTLKAHATTVDLSALRNVLSVDPATKTALVEPNVPMDRLVATTLQYGLVPPVVMEFPGITAGGGYAGTAGESSSWKHGYFDRTLNWVEIVLGNGDVVKASDSEHADLFHGAAGAVGSLGITTLMELQLVDAKKYVKATYYPVSSTEEALAKIKEIMAKGDVEYIDGILFSPTSGAVIAGALSDTSEGPVQYFSRPWDPWFYLHVQSKIQASKPVVESIPLAEYLFRYDRGGFWVGESAFKYFYFPFNRFTRWFLDDFLHTRVLYRALHASRQSMRFVVQDLAMPFQSAPEFVKYTGDAFNIWPLWLCPLKQSAAPTFHPHNSDPKMGGSDAPLINVGLWGDGPKDHAEFVALNQHLETTLQELGGTKWFYAQTYYTEQGFWSLYNKPWYQTLREKYHATTLPTVYDKIRVDVEKDKIELANSWKLRLLRTWPVSGVYGIWKSILSGDWKLPKSTKVAALTIPSSK